MGRVANGFMYLGRYQYARILAKGRYSLYEGMYSDRAEDRTSGLEVVRDYDGKPLRFNNIEEVKDYCGLGGKMKITRCDKCGTESEVVDKWGFKIGCDLCPGCTNAFNRLEKKLYSGAAKQVEDWVKKDSGGE